MVYTTRKNPADALREQGQLRVETQGSSMQPLLKSGRNTVHLRALEGEPALYDVVLFRRRDGSFVLHRIIGAENGTYTLLGDHQTQPESGIARGQILGRMAGYYTGERYRACSAVPYRLYVRAWCGTLPLRRLWAGVWRRLGGSTQ